MKVQKVQYYEKQEKMNDAQNFKGGGDAFLRFLATEQAIGANSVDLAFMVAPRTASDWGRRGPLAGMETMRREASGTANHTLIGVYGIGAGALVAAMMGINGKYGINANKIMAAPETLVILAENKETQLRNNESQIDYLRKTLKNLRAFNPASERADKDGFVKLSDKTTEEVAQILDNAINDKNINLKTWSNAKTSNSLDVVRNMIIADTGSESKYILDSAKSAVKNGAEKAHSNTTLNAFLEDVYEVSETFNKKNVESAFKDQIKENKGILDNKFIKSLSKYKNIKSITGFAIAAGVGMSIQPINMYLTKKKTGQDGFVGVAGRTKDTSASFFALKAASAAAFFGMTLATLQTGLKGFMGKMAFKGFWPTISQLKGVYGLTIMSRIMSARDKDELRESLTKDTLGFLSWLVLGDIVNRMTAEGMDKTVLNRSKEHEKDGFFKRVFNSTLKTRDEVLMEALAKDGMSTIEYKDGKAYAKTFATLREDLEKMKNTALKNATKKKLRTLNAAQLAGYAFSGLVLGLGIPNLNIYITNKLDRKRKAEAAEKEAQVLNQNIAKNVEADAKEVA